MPTTPKTTTPKIKVIGVGGAGCNAVSFLHQEQVKHVQLIACNTNAEALANSPVPYKLLLGDITLQQNAGASESHQGNATVENQLQEIRALLGDDTEMVFVVAGMGGSAGTGAAPLIAQTAKNLGILTVGIVTLPFGFEGEQKVATAAAGVEALQKSTDALLILSNENLRVHYGELLRKDAFRLVDKFVANTVRAVADIVNVTAEVNVDIEDVKLVLADAGTAMVGTAITSGENRAMLAAQESLDFKLLVKNNIRGAHKILLSIMSGEQADLQMDELTDITEYIQDQAGQEAEVIFGHGIDPALDDKLRITVIATNFAADLAGVGLSEAIRA